MSLVRALLRRLFPPDCEECGARYDGRMLGTYWHADSCSAHLPRYPDTDDDE